MMAVMSAADTLQIVLESTLRFTQTGEQITAAARLAGVRVEPGEAQVIHSRREAGFDESRHPSQVGASAVEP